MTEPEPDADAERPDSPASDGPSTTTMIIAALLGIGVLSTFLVVARSKSHDFGPVPVATVPAPQAESPDCAKLLDAVPDQLGDYETAEIADPAPAGVAAWRDSGEFPVIMRCGLDRPGDFVVGSPIQQVDDVGWFRVAEGDRVTWYAVDRPVYVALTLPDGSGPAPIQQLSRVIAEVLPAQAIDPAPPR
ncbi:DUF3515 domain-containing protein [Mycolicibacterium brumae]|nr:DUF3515 domain-containing protein [Mycolicibacterium brumae]UWW08062.1 DUF3515 domain-containing protein [Mycolicibacterium brumae]